MSEMEILIDFYSRLQRQGPGGQRQTLLAATMAGLNREAKNLNIADIGCGTGSSSLVLADNFDAHVTAVDLFPEFLEILERNSKEQKLDRKITTVKASMDELPFSTESFDVIWSEGAIYNMGFSKGIEEWEKFLKKDGVLAVSEITWLTNSRPTEVQNYWEQVYPEMALASEKISQLEKSGYQLLGYFPLPKSCWLENYYQPLEGQFLSFINAHDHSEEAKKLVENEKSEIKLFKKYGDYYGYGFYIAQKL